MNEEATVIESGAGRRAPALVVMGVSASGKSTFGEALAAAIGYRFTDADDLHSAANVAKMAAGIPLTDEDRRPWLESVGAVLATGAASGGIVVACSALRRAYRDRLRASEPSTAFLHLAAPEAVLAERVRERHGHFMPASLLGSQFATLEPLEADERGLVLDARAPVPELVTRAEQWLESPGA